MVRKLTEDQVRDGYAHKDGFFKGAKQILEFDKYENNVSQGTGQITTFKSLGFTGKGSNHKPDGWYLPDDVSKVAIILETKSSDKDIESTKFTEELLANVKIANSKYPRVVGILFNGIHTRVFLNDEEQVDTPKKLQTKSFYTELFNNFEIDTNKIYLTTMKINNLLHFKFGLNDYYDRMVFTACALVAKRYEAPLTQGMSYTLLHFTILDTLSKSLEEAKKQNDKLNVLLDTYSRIQMSITDNQNAIDSFIEHIETISKLINSKYWNGEDVMSIFFNEFNRYKGSSKNGQVFTPEHITSFMYKLINIDPKKDRVLDAACGSGAFLTKAMSNMIKESGGPGTKQSGTIMASQIYGIEIDKRIFSLACANMLIHKDGKTNLEQLDSTSEAAGEWINSKNITRVLMNPPYERKYHPELIIKNVLDNIKPRSLAAFLLPDKKLEKISKKVLKNLLENHRILKIIKLPEKTFDEGVTTSIFIFESGISQNNEEIFTCYIKDDGLERVKNQGRQDINKKWSVIENKWVEVIKKQSGDDSIKWIKPSEHLSYQKDLKEFEVFEEDFKKSIFDYLMFKEDIDLKKLKENISEKVIYSSDITKRKETGIVSIVVEETNNGEN
ncbi:type II DNA modification methyltransferase [Streptococcus criceti]|uniref:site-specific DNA-methyltransferase (adenine-specific) n=1 Tax=Streptococcus criceti HS-6 TaxID=873449 RepID=G5JT26_STRCG|nr:N-6 DNA methylase [Streptococcus criceti]EHI75007.1 hypothetical protein STRCR_0994 [Streptococcus criceti HS-6]SUN37493.1 type II DNA modification methyltransferase [Streptococcus criceti]SUN37573.1 type II DNA modification methyltransferase [Streptococcus criceti]